MSTQTDTVAQALQTTASGIIVADSPANIAAVVGNTGLVSRVSQFTMLGNDVVNAAQAESLSTLGSLFTRGGYTLTERDSVAAVIDPANAPGLSVASQLEVVDNIDNLLTAIDNPIVRSANTLTLTTDSTLRVAQLLTFESFPHFNAAGTTIVLADTAANLLTVTPAETLPQVKGFALCYNSTVSAANAATLYSKPGFWISVNVTLTVSDTLANIGSFVANHAAMAGMAGVALTVADSVSSLTSGSATLTSLANAHPSLTATLAASETVAVSQLAGLLAVPHFTVGAGNQLVVSDSVAHLASMTAAQAALATDITATDTVAALVQGWASSLPVLADLTAAAAQLDNGNYTLVQLAPLANLASRGDLTVTQSSGNTALHVVDTLQDLASGSAELADLRQAAAVVTTPSDDHTIMSAAAAAALATTPGFNPGNYTLAVSDTGAAVASAAAAIFSHGFQAITVTSGAFAGPVADLLDPTLHLAPGSSAQLADDAIVNTATLAQLAALPGFGVAGSATLTVQDTAIDLAAHADAVAQFAGMVEVSSSPPVDAATADALAALQNAVGAAHFSLGGNTLTLSDSAANLVDPANSAGVALADSLVISGNTPVNASQALEIIALSAKLAPDDTVPVSDSAANLLALVSFDPPALSHISSITVAPGDPVTAAQAHALSTLPNLMIDFSLCIADSVTNLLQGSGAQPDNWAGELLASQITLTGDATIDAAQAQQLAQLGARLDNGGHNLLLRDTPSALLSALDAIGPISTQITATLLADNATPWEVSIAQATQLSMLPHVQVDAAHATLADSPANLLAPVDAVLVAQAPSVSLNGNATVSVQTAQALHALANFSLGTHDGDVANQLTISDGAGHLATLDAATAAMATAIQLQGDGIVSVAQFDAIRALPHYTDTNKLLLVSDSAANLLTLAGSDMHLASAIMLAPDTSDSGMTADQAQQLASLPGFTPGIAQIGVLDSAADLLRVSGAGSAPDDWAGELIAGGVTLSQDGVVSASQAAELALLGSRFHLGTYSLTVSDGAAELTASANATGLALATHVQLAGSEDLTAAGATRLAAIAGLDKGGSSVTVTDSAANLAFAGYADGVNLADIVQLNAATSLGVDAAEALIGMANFAATPAAPLSISDSLANLLGLGSADLLHNDAVLQATPIALSGDTVATVAQMHALATLPEAAQFSLGGHALTVIDSGKHLADFTPAGTIQPSSYTMTGDATLTATQADALAHLAVNLDGNTLTIADMPAALLDSANTDGVTLADALALSGNATVDAATAEALEGIAKFTTGGHVLTVSDTAQALLGMDSATQQMAGILALQGPEMVDATTLAGLTRLGIKFSLDGHDLQVGDSADHLSGLNSWETALTSGQILTVDSVISAAMGAQLAALPDFAVSSGVSLTVQDSVANLLALSPAVQAIATEEQLVPGANLAVTAADAAALAALLHFSNAGATINVDDTIAALTAPANAGWQSVDTAYMVTDSLSNLLGNADSPLLTSANGVELLGDTQTDAATLETLAAIPGFRAGSAALTIVDGPAAIAAQAGHIAAFATGAQISASTPVSAADAEALAGLNSNGLLSLASGVHVAVEDSFAALTAPDNAGGLALASSIIVLDDIGPLLTAMQADWGGPNPTFELDADGSVNGAQAAIVSAAGSHFLLNGHTLSVQDDAAGAAANAGTLASLGLAVTVIDTATNVSTHASDLIGLGSALTAVDLSDTAPLDAASAAGLSGLAGKLGGNSVYVSDTAGAVDTNLSALQLLGSHLGSVQVTGLAAEVGTVASDLSVLGSLLTVHLSDTQPVDSNVALGLVPIIARLEAGTHVDVSDLGTTLAASASGLQQMDSVLGTLTISDGNTVDAATAAALAPLDGHFGASVELQVDDTAAAISSAKAGLAQLQLDGHLAGVAATQPLTTADVASYGADLASVGAQVTIADSAALVSASLDGLQDFIAAGGAITGVSLTDGGSPDITVSVGQLTSDAGILAAASLYHLAVVDSPETIAADLGDASELVAHEAQIDSISLDQPGYVMLSTSQITDATLSTVLAMLPPDSVVVGPVAVDAIASVLASGGGTISSIGVVDDASAIQSDLALGTNILDNLSYIASITANAGNISLTEAEVTRPGVDNGATPALIKLIDTTLTVTGAAIADLATLIALAKTPDHIAIQDTAAAIGSELASGAPDLQSVPGQIDSIAVSDSANAVALTQAEASAVLGLLAKVDGTVAVSGVDLASLPSIAALSGPELQIAVSDTAAHIEAGLTSAPDLVTYSSLLTGVYATDGAISLTALQVLQPNVDDSGTSALAHLGTGLTVTGASVSDLPQLDSLQTLPGEIDVSDTAANIQADLTSGASQLTTSPITLGAIAISDSGTITLSDADASTASTVLSLATGGSLEITGVPVADIGTMATLSGLSTTLHVMDSATAVEAATTAGQPITMSASQIRSVAVDDGTLDAATAAAVYSDLHSLSISFDETNLTISDTAAALLNAESATPEVLSAAHAITLGSDALDLTAADATVLLSLLGNQLGGNQLTLSDSAANLLDPANGTVLAAASSVALNNGTPINAQEATQLIDLGNFNAGSGLAVADAPDNLLDPANSAGVQSATSVTPNADYSVSAAILGQLDAIPNYTNGGHQLTLQDNVANVSAASPALLALANGIDVTDTAANVSANLDALQANLLDRGYSPTISVSDAVANTPAISIDASTYSNDRGAIDSIDTAGVVSVTGNAAELSALAATLHDDTVVGEVDVQDTPTNILLNLPALESIGAKFIGGTVSGATVTAAEVAQLMTIPNLLAGSLIVSDSGSQIAAAIAANGQAGVDFLNNQSVQLNQNSVITGADAQALESLTNFGKAGFTLSVWDSATHLTDSFDHYLAAVSNGIIDHVYLHAIGGAATVTASTAATLFSIPNFDKSNPDDTQNVLTVQDTAAHIGSAYSALSANSGQIDHVVVSASATVTDALFGELQQLNATKATGITITVRDTASAIIGGAPSQTSGPHSLTPDAWMLSGSAVVNEAGIAYLGGLAGFSAGAYTLTLSQDATTTVSDANAIAALGNAFQLGTHHLLLSGSIADMASLSSAAQALVVPEITDTFANIAGLPPSSGLLGGTITVSDSEPVTVAQVSSFLALLKVGNGPGIPAANVSFAGNVETVTDTLGSIQTLTGASAWAENANVHSDFSLVVADTVANLIDPGNLVALSAVAGSALSGNQTASAADAESLFAVRDTIHFGLDGHTLTVQDTAANLLDPVNLDAVGMASIVTLSASNTVSAADAETLLSWGNFQVTDPSVMLTISDSSDALLDNALLSAIGSSGYASHLQVELAGPEVLDAQTAERLVSLAHFVDTGALSIQDSASYLLNPNNHDAEQSASSVMLAGDEAVSAATAVHLSQVPHFDLDGFTLHLATNDYADAATLKTIADFGSGFVADGHTLTMTQDAIGLTPSEYNAVQAEVVSNGHAFSAIPGITLVDPAGGNLTVNGSGVTGATVTLYDADGRALTIASAAPTFVVSAADAGVNMSLTETIGGNAATGESAPVVLLEQSALESLVAADSATFSASEGANAVQVGNNEYLALYDAASAPANPVNPVLAYDAASHHLLLDVDQQAPVILVTLGGATTPAHLDISEIMIKHQLG